MEERRQRKRIPLNVVKGMPAVVDSEAFFKNKSSEHAKLIMAIEETIGITLCFDKHYIDRHQHGDDDGEERLGIEKSDVKDLVLESVKHMMFYSAVLPSFTFLNHTHLDIPVRGLRMVCRKETDAGMLNVVIESHYLSLNNYEITVMTAMCTEGFRISDNQYVIEVVEDGSTLFRMQNRVLTEIYRI